MKLLKELVVMTTTIICGLIMVSSCSSDSFESQKPAMLTIEATNLKLVVGETEARVATTNSDGAVTYISSDVAVATVDKEGKVTAVSAGEATITVLVAKTARFTFAQTSYKVIVGFARVVDLGLSVKWADRNVGASNPEDYGDYFSWGETTATGNYDWSTYTLCEGTVTSMTKYCNDSDYGHNGFTGTSLYVDRETGMYVILLTNRVHYTRQSDGLYRFRRRLHNAATADYTRMIIQQ